MIHQASILNGNKFYDNTTCVFDSAQQTFPKLLQKAGYQTAIIGKWHLESLPSGFDYWQIVPGQGITIIRISLRNRMIPFRSTVT